MNRTAVDSSLKNKYGSAFRILGIFLDELRRAGAREEVIYRESIVSESVVAAGRLDEPERGGGCHG